MPNEPSLVNAAIKSRLDEIDHVSFYDPGKVPQTPPGAYVIRYPGLGITNQERYDGKHYGLRLEYTVMCVSNSIQGVMDVVNLVRGKIDGWRPPVSTSIDPLTESMIGIIVPDTSVPGDTRYSVTMVYSTQMSRSG